MAQRLVDTVTGIGSVHAGNLILRATRYRLSFWINDDLPAHSIEANSATTVDGRIEISGIAEAAVLAGSIGMLASASIGARQASGGRAARLGMIAIKSVEDSRKMKSPVRKIRIATNAPASGSTHGSPR